MACGYIALFGKYPCSTGHVSLCTVAPARMARGGIAKFCGSGEQDHAATRPSVVSLFTSPSGRSTSLPPSNRAPARTSATSLGPLTLRQRCSAASSSLKTIANPAAALPGPLVTLVRARTGAKVLSIGFVVRRCSQCSAG
jgi:hypothetical protein